MARQRKARQEQPSYDSGLSSRVIGDQAIARTLHRYLVADHASCVVTRVPDGGIADRIALSTFVKDSSWERYGSPQAKRGEGY